MSEIAQFKIKNKNDILRTIWRVTSGWNETGKFNDANLERSKHIFGTAGVEIHAFQLKLNPRCKRGLMLRGSN